LRFRFIFDVYVQTRLQAQAAGVPYHYQGPCHMACFYTNTVCLHLVLWFFTSNLLLFGCIV